MSFDFRNLTMGNKWSSYYWLFLKKFGNEFYRTWRWELAASVVSSISLTVVIYFFDSTEYSRAWKDLKLVLLATALTMFLFALWHLVHSPWLLHKMIMERDASEHWAWGMLGIVALVAILFSGYMGIQYAWSTRNIPVVINIPAPSKPINQVQPISRESKNSLRRRILRLSDKLDAFGKQRAELRRQVPDTRDSNGKAPELGKFDAESTALYVSSGMKEETLGVIRDIKSKGLDTGFLQMWAEQQALWSGIYPTSGELLTLREFAYHFDANDNVIQIRY